MLDAIAKTLGFVFGLGAFVSWAVVWINMIRVTSHIKDGAWFWGRKTNALFYASLLTERGLAVRRQFFYGLFSFAVCMALLALLFVAMSWLGINDAPPTNT
jgi:hypothetical protein